VERSASLQERSSSHRTPRFTRFKELRLALPSAAAAALVAVIALGVFFGFWREGAPVATIQLIPTPQESVGLKGYWGVAEIRPQPSGNQQVELKLNNFEEPQPGRYYELWFVSGDKRISAGSFTSVGEGETRILLNVPPEASKYHTLLITEENAGKGSGSDREVALKGDMP
jgi:anti-sigma-K factor RskA